MPFGRLRTQTAGTRTACTAAVLRVLGLLLSVSHPACDAFNLDVQSPAVYSGPPGSYFGYAVDFYLSESAR